LQRGAGQSAADQLRGRGREQHLLAVCSGHDSRSAVQRRSEIVSITEFGCSAVQPHAYSDRDRSIGWLRDNRGRIGHRILKSALRLERRGDCIPRSAEDSVNAIASGLDDVSARRFDRRA